MTREGQAIQTPTTPATPADGGAAPVRDQVRIGEMLPDGAMLGKYQILERVGRGGMAVVYRARDTSLDRLVAVKQIAAHLSDDARWRDRFKKEAQVIAKVASNSRHIVHIYELVEDANGLFIVMEYVQGHTLDTLLRANRLDAQAAMDILGGICLGLRSVHAAGIVHRDIKPGNVIVPPDRRVKITDFGVAAHLGGDDSMALGTTKYMAPELFGAGPIDGRADIYSLGMLAFEMFAGRKQFDALFTRLLGEGRSEAMRWMNWHLRMDTPLPRLDEINPTVPPALAEIVAQMVAKSLSVRYPDINAVIADLKRNFSQGGAAAASATAATQGAKPATAGAFHSSGAAAATDPSEAGLLGLRVGPGTTVTGGAGFGGVFEGDVPTAQVPKRGMTRRKKIAIAAGVALSAAATILIIVMSGPPNELQAVQALYQAGKTDYDAGKYAEAVAKWNEAAAMPVVGPEGDEARKLLAWCIPLAEARLALTARNFEAAEQKLEESQKKGAPPERVGQLREDAARGKRRDEALKQFDQNLAEGDLEKAAVVLRDVEDGKLTDDADLVEWRSKLEKAREESSYLKQFRAARAALNRGEFDQALKIAETAAGDQPSDELRAFILTVRTEKSFAEARRNAEQALAVGDFKSAAEHWKEANRLKPSAEMESRYRGAKAQEHAVAARAARQGGRLADAKEQFELSLKFQDVAVVRLELQRLTDALELQRKIDDGQQAADAGDWDRALEVWQDAMKGEVLDRGEELREKVTLAQLQVALARGDRFAREKKWAEAEAAYREAESYGGADEAGRRIEQLRIARQVDDLAKRGDVARDAGQLAQAIKCYRDALKLKNAPDGDIQKRLDDVSFRRFKSEGERKLREKNYRAALADLRQAQRIRPEDAEVTRLIKQAEAGAGGSVPP